MVADSTRARRRRQDRWTVLAVIYTLGIALLIVGVPAGFSRGRGRSRMQARTADVASTSWRCREHWASGLLARERRRQAQWQAWLRLGFVGRRLEPLDEIAGIDTEALGDLEQVVQTQVASATLDLAEKGPVDTSLRREGFLAEAESLPPGTDSFAEGFGSWG
jgi:hypothetical protein